MTVDHDDESFIERCPHDEENPYTIIHNDLIRNASLTPGCRWLLIYLLSNVKNWKISVQQLINHLKPHRGFERRSIYKLINEAIEAGYMKREQDNKGKFGKVKYFLSEKPKFKKCLPQYNLALAEKCTHKKKQLVVSSPPQGGEETQQQEQPVVAASLPAEAGEAVVQAAAEKSSAIADDGLKWDLPIDELAKLMKFYGIEYVDKQLNYISKKYEKVTCPISYLIDSCKNNYAKAKRDKKR